MHSITISAPDRAIEKLLENKVDRKTKPLGALGQLEALAVQIGTIQQTLTPILQQPQMLVFAGDHGAAKAGISAYPQDVTWQMVGNFLDGGAAINVFCRQNGIALSVVDAGVAHDFETGETGETGDRPRFPQFPESEIENRGLSPVSEKPWSVPGFINAKIAHGTANYLEQPAMTSIQCAEAITRGAAIVRELAGQGCNVVGFGEMGIGNTASASLITHCLTDTPLHDCIGRGTGLDDAGLARKQGLLEQAIQRRQAEGEDKAPLSILAEFGGFEIAMMVGAMLAGAEAKMLLLIDGFIVGSAALVASRLQPALLDYCVFCHRSAEPGHRAQLQAMQAEPLLDLGLRLGEGTGAALAWPLVQAAVAFLNEMASFESAGVARQS